MIHPRSQSQVLVVRRSFFEDLASCATHLAPDFNPQNCSNAATRHPVTGQGRSDEERMDLEDFGGFGGVIAFFFFGFYGGIIDLKVGI